MSASSTELALAAKEDQAAIDRVQMHRTEKGITARVEVTLTEQQWNDAIRSLGMRAICCSIGLDSPSIKDFIVFQVIGQVSAFAKAAKKAHESRQVQQSEQSSKSRKEEQIIEAVVEEESKPKTTKRLQRKVRNR